MSGRQAQADPSTRTPPGPRGYPLVGVLPRIWRDPLAFFSDVAAECGGLARVGLGKFTLHLLTEPDWIQEVLLDDGSTYWKGAGLAAAEPVMGQGLATSEGDHWKRQRRLMQPSFQPRRRAHWDAALAGALEALVDGWVARAGRRHDVAPDLNLFAQQAIFRPMFGADVQADLARELGAAVAECNRFINHAAWKMLPIPDSWPTPGNVRFRRALATLDATIYRLIAERRAAAAPGEDLLGRLVGARDDDAGMSDREIRDEITTQFVAGYETTANALCWTMWLLAEHPEAQERVAAEAQAGREPDQLAFTRCVIQESMRLYPPSWVIVRTPYRDVTLGEFDVPKDSTLLISQWVVHRRADVWERPTEFDPSRWEDGGGPPHRFAYFPFGGGRRTCIGNHLALRVLELAVAAAAARLRWTPGGKPPQPRPLTTLRPHGKVTLRLDAR